MLGRVFATVYELLTSPSPSTPISTIWRRNPVTRDTRLATAIRLLDRPSDGAGSASVTGAKICVISSDDGGGA
ncbi:hypothetical protein GCM10010210_12170 [Pseudonocardia hydrocarbonoxydans]|uniref:Uncharacterized protein n=1 Tax=Pseudonocardia hydrocarbonoxydans TaxID=76726 RepID=A0A4Y3WSC2_9PSEU|nr:hypothetical protein PHY01_40450 [Pseudonocardia hydrocarbonoxydans]